MSTFNTTPNQKGQVYEWTKGYRDMTDQEARVHAADEVNRQRNEAAELAQQEQHLQGNLAALQAEQLEREDDDREIGG